MKNLFLIFALTASTFAYGQEKGHPERMKMSPEEKTEKVMERMTEQLDLTDAQVTSLRQVILEKEKYRREKFNEMKAQRETMRAEMKQANEESYAKMKTILTPEQLKKLEEIKAEHKQKRMDGKHKGYKHSPKDGSRPAGK